MTVVALVLARLRRRRGARSAPARTAPRWWSRPSTRRSGSSPSSPPASPLLTYAFLTFDFSVRYVASNTNLGTPFYYRITAVWGALEGSIILWSWMLALYTLILIVRHRTARASSTRGRSRPCLGDPRLLPPR